MYRESKTEQREEMFTKIKPTDLLNILVILNKKKSQVKAKV